MRESGAVVVSGAIEKNLSLAVESAEGSAVYNPRAVTLDFRAVTVTGLQVQSSGGAIWGNRPWRKLAGFLARKVTATACGEVFGAHWICRLSQPIQAAINPAAICATSTQRQSDNGLSGLWTTVCTMS